MNLSAIATPMIGDVRIQRKAGEFVFDPRALASPKNFLEARFPLFLFVGLCDVRVGPKRVDQGWAVSEPLIS